MPIRWEVWAWDKIDHLMALRILLIICNLCSAVLIVTVWSIILHLHYLIYQNFHRLPVEPIMIHYRNLTLQCLENNLTVILLTALMKLFMNVITRSNTHGFSIDMRLVYYETCKTVIPLVDNFTIRYFIYDFYYK